MTMTIEERNAKIQEWLSAKASLDSIKETEKELREEVISMCFPTYGKGTSKFDLGGGYGLSLSATIDTKVEQHTVNEAIQEIIEEFELDGENAINEVFTKEVKASFSKFEKLPEGDLKKRIENILITKLNSPQLKFERPSES